MVEFYHGVDDEAARNDLHAVHDVADGFTRSHLSLQLQGQSTRGHDEHRGAVGLLQRVIYRMILKKKK